MAYNRTPTKGIKMFNLTDEQIDNINPFVVANRVKSKIKKHRAKIATTTAITAGVAVFGTAMKILHDREMGR